MAYFSQLIIMGLTVGSVYGLIALGIVFIYKATGVFNFAQGAIAMLGGYTAFNLIMALDIVPWWVCVLISLLLAVIIGYIVERLILRPLTGKPLLIPIIATIGLASIASGSTYSAFGAGVHRYIKFFPSTPVSVGAVSIGLDILCVGAVAIGLVIVSGLFFLRSKVGLLMRITADDDENALSLGIDINSMIRLSWILGLALAMIGGVLLSGLYGLSTRIEGLAFVAFPVLVIGGFDSILGAIVGGIIVGLVELLTAGYITPLIGGVPVQGIIPYFLLLIVLLLKPYGLFGTAEVRRI